MPSSSPPPTWRKHGLELNDEDDERPPKRREGGGFGMGFRPLGIGFMPSSEKEPVLNADFDERPVTPRMAAPSAFSTPTIGKSARGSNAQKPPPINAGSFAARMMAKMGYKEGQGLGKDGQGRSGVIEVQLRPQGVGLGAVREKSQQEKEEEKRQAKIRGETLEDSDDEKKKRRRKASPRGSGTESGTSTPRRKPKPKYQTLPEIQRAAPGLQIPDAFTTILDMTGPGERLLTSASGLLTPTAGLELSDNTELVEARKLARRAQNDLGAFVEEWKNLEERKAWVEMEILQQQQLVDEQRKAADEMSAVASKVQGVSGSVADGQWDPVITALSDIEELGIADNDELASIAVASIYPFFRQAVEGWQPLQDPKLSGVAADGFAPALLGIQHLLGISPQLGKGASLVLRDGVVMKDSNYGRAYKTTPFESLMYTLWFPKVRSAITNIWDVYDPTPLQTLLSVWDGLLPHFIKSQILNELVVRKLDEAVDSWNPKKRRQALPHLWLFPWLQYLGPHHTDPKSSTGLVSDIKRKFRHLIDAWDFKRGVIPGLQQWRSVLQSRGGSDQWTPLLINHVLPNLARYLRTNFKVAPQDQEPYMIYLDTALQWQEILGTKMTSQLVVEEVFPMWLEVLHTWLTLEGVNYAEIGEWIDFWVSIIPESLNKTPVIQAEWQRGKDLINDALDLGPSAKSALPLPIKTSKLSDSARLAEEEKAAESAKPVRQAEEVTFREKVEDFCMENELQFLPQKSMLDAHGPVYRITAAPVGKGGILIYFSRGEHVFAQMKRTSWVDLGNNQDTLDALLELAHN